MRVARKVLHTPRAACSVSEVDFRSGGDMRMFRRALSCVSLVALVAACSSAPEPPAASTQPNPAAMAAAWERLGNAAAGGITSAPPPRQMSVDEYLAANRALSGGGWAASPSYSSPATNPYPAQNTGRWTWDGATESPWSGGSSGSSSGPTAGQVAAGAAAAVAGLALLGVMLSGDDDSPSGSSAAPGQTRRQTANSSSDDDDDDPPVLDGCFWGNLADGTCVK